MSEENTLKISKTMLIIKSDMNSLKGVEQFLKNREWYLKSTNQLKEAVLFLVQNKPSFVLVSIDHPNKKMQKLPKILASAFPCCVMVYAEKPTTAAFKALLDSGAEYKINPPITGPAIERAVNKYIRDQEQLARQKDPNFTGQNGEKGNFDFQVEIKAGAGDKAAGFVTMTAESGQTGEGAAGILGGGNSSHNSFAQNLLAQLGLASGDDESGAQIPGVIQSGKGDPAHAAALANAIQNPDQYLNSAGQLSGHLNGNQTGHQNDQANRAGVIGSLPIDSSRRGPGGKDGPSEGQVINLPLMGKENTSQTAELGGSLKGKKSQVGSESSENGEAGSLGFGQKNRKKTGAHGSEEESEFSEPDVLIGRARTAKKNQISDEEELQSAKDLYVPTGDRKKDGSPNEEAGNRKGQDIIIGKNADDLKGGRRSENHSEDANGGKLNSRAGLKVRKSSGIDEDSILIRGVNKTVDETVDKGNGAIEQKLEDNTHLACIIVESPRFSGYLVAALGKDKKMDDGFVELVRTRLMKFLRDSGEQIDQDQNMQIKVKRVDFEGWALEYAQFLKKSVHKGDEVAMAFFPFADAQTKLGESANSTMVSVKTSEIQTDVPLEFNLYIYLPSNKKYILYTPERGKFLPEQKVRLMRQGVQDLHIRKDDVQNLSKFKAQNHLNSLIDDFDEKNKAKKKAS